MFQFKDDEHGFYIKPYKLFKLRRNYLQSKIPNTILKQQPQTYHPKQNSLQKQQFINHNLVLQLPDQLSFSPRTPTITPIKRRIPKPSQPVSKISKPSTPAIPYIIHSQSQGSYIDPKYIIQQKGKSTPRLPNFKLQLINQQQE